MEVSSGSLLRLTNSLFVAELAYSDGRATSGTDYNKVGDDNIIFNEYETTVTKMVDIEADNVLEYNEMFFLMISIPAGALADCAKLDSPSMSEVIIKDRKNFKNMMNRFSIHLNIT